MMATIGRHKNQSAAIKVAKRTGMKLILAGKIRDEDYYRELQKDIDGEKIKWVGELEFEEKVKEGFVGHHPDTEWFCKEHLKSAEKYNSLELSEALKLIIVNHFNNRMLIPTKSDLLIRK